jgi:hypothetical protein
MNKNTLKDFTGLMPVEEVELSEEDDKENEMLRSIFNRKVHDYKTGTILDGTKEDADKVRLRPVGRLTASD